MGAKTGISWCDATFNPWRGCTKVSPGCANCYAEKQSKRNPAVLGVWGDGGTRVAAAESYWKLPLKWNAAAAKAGERRRVFCASLADVFEDRPELELPRDRLFDLIRGTPHLDWLLLTKRPENVSAALARSMNRAYGVPQVASEHAEWLEGWLTGIAVPPNIWLGVSVEDQARADERIPHLLRVPAAVRFLSCEPLLGPLDLIGQPDRHCRDCYGSGISDNHTGKTDCGCIGENHLDGIQWVIVGGESGPSARPCHLQWVRSLRDQCAAAGVACFIKQLGSFPVRHEYTAETFGNATRRFRDPKGGDPEEWEPGLRVREFPR